MIDPVVVDTALFWVFAGVAVASALVVILQRSPIYSAFALIVTLCALSAIYGLLGSPFIAVLQIVVYAGAIMVLFLFVIMLVNIERSQKEEQFNKQWLVGILAAVALGVLFVLVYAKGKSLFPEHAVQLPEQSNTQQIAVLLYGNYMFAFEIASLLLLVAIIGAVVMAKKRI